MFVRITEERFFGFDDVEVLREKVTMAAKERAVLDAVDRPHLVGEVSGVRAEAVMQISLPTSLKFTRRWNESPVVQRLGCLLDLRRIELSSHTREEPLRLVNPESGTCLRNETELPHG